MKRELHVFTLCLIFMVCGGPFAILEAQSQPEAGFYTLEENYFYFHTNSYFNRIALRSSPARLWYVFQPADKDPADKPVFVFFNGGPGGATSAGLLSAFTGRRAVNLDTETGDSSIIKNPASWTSGGNLLYIDARTTGFSYSLMDDPQDRGARRMEFDSQNYNCFFDGADFIRVILRFLRDHPELRDNPVVIVGESYGGIRSNVMLHLLLYYQTYGSGEAIFQDSQLAQEIQEHYNSVFPDYLGQTVPPAVIAGQFSHQILIQPAVTRPYQKQVASEKLEAPGSVVYQLASETGVPYIRYQDQPYYPGWSTPSRILNNVYAYLEKIDRDAYMYSMNDGFLLGYFSSTAELLSQYTTLNQMLGIDSAGIPELYASARLQGYKISDTENVDFAQRDFTLMGPLPLEQDIQAVLDNSLVEGLSLVFGNLQPWDRYFIDLNYDANGAFGLSRTIFYGYDIYYGDSPRFGQMFLENVAWVDTFITNAALDLVVFSAGLPDALDLHTEMLASSWHDAEGPPGEVRPGQIILDYHPSVVPGSDVQRRMIRFPRYALSGHAVTLNEPAEILADVFAWLSRTGLPVAEQAGDVR